MSQQEQYQRILHFVVQDVLRVEAIDITPPPDEPLIVIGGDNGQGKSSALRAIAWVCEGKSAIDTKQPVRRGASEDSTPHILIETEDYIFTREFDVETGGSKLIARSKAGGHRFTSPQDLMDRMISDLSFDPVDFMEKKPAQQRELLMQILGLNFADLDMEASRVYKERTTEGQVRDRLKGQLAGLQFYPDAPTEEISLSALTTELQQAQAHNRKNAGERATLTNQQNIRTADQKRIDDRQAEVTDLEQKLEAARQRLAEAKQMAEATDGRVAAQQAVVDALPADIDEQAIMTRMQEAEGINQKVRANAQRTKISEELDAAVTAIEAKTTRLAEIEAAKTKAIAEAHFPIEGLSFNDDGLLYNGFPFPDNASNAEQLRVAVSIALAMNPTLRVIVVRCGNDLDLHNLGRLRELAREFNVQIWLERVGKGPEVNVVIEDGKVAENRLPGAQHGASEQ